MYIGFQFPKYHSYFLVTRSSLVDIIDFHDVYKLHSISCDREATFLIALALKAEKGFPLLTLSVVLTLRINGVLLFHGEITSNAVVISGKGDYIEHPEPSPAYAPCN